MKKYIVTAVAGFMIFGCGANVVSLDLKSDVKVANLKVEKLCQKI